MKSLIFGTILLAASYSATQGAIIFSGGTGGDPVTVTLTQDLYLPVTVPMEGSNIALVVLEDVYDAPATIDFIFPQTYYGQTGSITAQIIPTVGAPIEAQSYNVWGAITATYGIIDPTDFYWTFSFEEVLDLNVGDIFHIRAGSVVMGNGVRLPENSPVSITGSDSSGNPFTHSIIPEPSTALLGALSALGLLHRRRA